MIMSLVEARDLDTSPPEWLADGIIPRIGVGIWHGPSYSAKSLTVDGELALAVANGTPFLGHNCVQGNVVLCLGEGLYDAGVRKQARLARQARDNVLAIAAVAAERGDEAARTFAAGLPPYTDERLYVHTEPFDVPITRSRDLSQRTRQALAAIRAMVESPELVIIDALADFTGGLSLSNDASANRLMLGLKMIAMELDCCVLAVAHNDKKGDALLGAQRLYNASDFVIAVTPDDVSAPGAPRTATISCEKSKYGPEFEPIGYRIEPCEWDEPERDDDGEPAGTTVTVSSATIRMIETGKPGPAARPAPPPLPAIREPEPPRKRNGLRRRAAGTAPHLAVVPGPAPAAPRTPRDLIAGMLSVPCPDCRALGGGMGCDMSVKGSGLVPLSLSPPLAAHADRILEAAIAGRADLDEIITWLGTLPGTPAPEPPPAAPEKPASDLDRRLWWTTVRPDREPVRS